MVFVNVEQESFTSPPAYSSVICGRFDPFQWAEDPQRQNDLYDAAAVITDIGAPLSHPAVIARELGIPALVGCGKATMRLHTGDRIFVDGVVTILNSNDDRAL